MGESICNQQVVGSSPTNGSKSKTPVNIALAGVLPCLDEGRLIPTHKHDRFCEKTVYVVVDPCSFQELSRAAGLDQIGQDGSFQ